MSKQPTLAEVHRIIQKIAEEHNKTSFTMITGEAGKNKFIVECIAKGMDIGTVHSMITPLKDGLYQISNEVK